MICTLCARGGSKGVKGKNLRSLLGKPLLAYSLLQAKSSSLFDCIAVSSDSEEILETAQKYGADHLIRRPGELATDTAGKIPAIQHCVVEVEKILGRTVETIVDLDATSPLRSAKDIRGAVRLLEESGCSNVITGVPARRSPYFNLVEEYRPGIVRLAKVSERPILRRQDAPQCFDMNASIYVWRRGSLFKQSGLFHPDTRIFVMPPERSLDVDSELDFEMVEFLAKRFRRFENEFKI